MTGMTAAIGGGFDPVEYRRRLWSLSPGLVPRDRLPAFIADVLAAPARRVTVGDGREKWTEHALEERCALGAFLTGAALHAKAEAACGVGLMRQPAIWAQSYAEGERIAWHRDAEGEIQFLVCLAAPDEEAGGVFRMRCGETDIRLALQPGDGLLFAARELPHSTTRLTPSRATPRPRRITAVARYFAA